MDLALSVPGVLFLAPAGLVIALAIRLGDGPPVFYVQPRVGRGGRLFNLLKFRTMAGDGDATGGGLAAQPSPVGALLRRFHLDELPQLVNVIAGEMSLVGPRPERPELVARYVEAIANYADRHEVLPGITGLAQVSLGDAITIENTRAKLRLDLEYIQSQTLLGDLRILMRTLPVTLGFRGSPWHFEPLLTPGLGGHTMGRESGMVVQ